MKKNTNKKGFTIVELVIVIAVIAILSAVLIPTFGNVIADANNVSRDQEAKNAYTTYISSTVQAGNDPANSGYIQITQGDTTYYYTVANGQIDLETEKKSGDTGFTVPTSGILNAPAASN